MDYTTKDNSNHPIYGEMRRRLSRVESYLDKKSSVLFQIIGVAHTGEPGDEIYKIVDKSDIVTLELSRTVVTKSDIGIHMGNDFWKSLVDYLKTKPDLPAYGVNLNRDALSCLKRFCLHLGKYPLPSPVVVEIFPSQEEEVQKIDFYLPENDVARLNLNGFVTTRDRDAFHHALNYIFIKCKKQLKFNDDLFAYDLKEPQIRIWTNSDSKWIDDKTKHSVTFFLPPDNSLVEAYNGVLGAIKNADGTGDITEWEWNAMEAFETTLFAPSSLTEAREITYVLDQAIKRRQITPYKDIVVTHIGGRGHMIAVADLLKKSIPSAKMNVSMIEDPRLPSFENDFYMSCLDKIPVEDAYECVVLENHEAKIIPNKVVELIMNMINKHPTEYRRALEYSRFGRHNKFKDFKLFDEIPGDIALRSFKTSFLLRQKLNEMSLEDVTSLRKQLDQEEKTYRDLLRSFDIPVPEFIR